MRRDVVSDFTFSRVEMNVPRDGDSLVTLRAEAATEREAAKVRFEQALLGTE
jgi:hypothetical protein